MLTFMHAHPWWSLLIAWAVLIVFFIAFGFARAAYNDAMGYLRTEDEGWAFDPYHDGHFAAGQKPILIFTVEDQISPGLRRVRHAMRNRFLPADDTSDAMVDQILGDQAVAHEQPGEVVTDPSVEPDATTFYHLREVIGQFTYIIGKDGYVGVAEAMRDGTNSPVCDVPEEWREPITVAVFEVARLRHG